MIYQILKNSDEGNVAIEDISDIYGNKKIVSSGFNWNLYGNDLSKEVVCNLLNEFLKEQLAMTISVKKQRVLNELFNSHGAFGPIKLTVDPQIDEAGNTFQVGFKFKARKCTKCGDMVFLEEDVILFKITPLETDLFISEFDKFKNGFQSNVWLDLIIAYQRARNMPQKALETATE